MSLPIRYLALAAVGLTPLVAADRLPDLVEDTGRIASSWNVDTTTFPGAVLIRLTATTPNIGVGPMEIRSVSSNPSGSRDVFQRIYDTAGGWRDHPAGIITEHPDHGHFHFQGFAQYSVRAVTPGNGVGAILKGGEKAGFCLMDLESWNLALPGAPARAVYGCSPLLQGVSVGWADTYVESLTDQWIDVTGLSSGTYWLEAVVDPENRLQELNEGNNAARVSIAYVNPQRLVSGRVFNDANANGANDGEAGLAGWRVWLDQDADGVLDLGAPTVAAAPGVPQPIDDVRMTTNFMHVAGLAGTIADVDLRINFSHTYVGDLRAYLVSPSGRKAELFNRIGGSADNFTNTVFDDAAATAITAGVAPYTGTFRPATPLSVFNGMTPNGDWRLVIFDDAGGDIGAITSWSLTFRSGEPSALTDAFGNYVIAGVGTGDHILRQQLQAGWRQSAPGSYRSLTVASDFTGCDFGNHRPNRISGLIFSDANRNQVNDVGESPQSGWTAYEDMDNDGIRDSSTTTAAGSGLPIAIPDLMRTVAYLTTSGLSGRITDVNLRLSLNHTFDGDLAIFLTSPSGQRVQVVNRVGGSGDNFINTVLDDEAATAIGLGSAPFTGSFNPSSALSAMDGTNANGEWKLEIYDRAGGDIGSLTAWSVVVASAEPSATSNASGVYTISNLGDGSHIVRENLLSGWQQTAPSGGFHTVTVNGGVTASGRNFGNYLLNSVAGMVFADLDGDGVRDVGESGLGGWTIFADENSNGVRDIGSRTVPSVDVPKAIADFSTAASVLNVVEPISAVTDLNVRLSITHTYDADLGVYLVAPTGRRIELFSAVGGSADNFTNTVLDDEAAIAIAAGAAPFTGSFRPKAALSAFDGISPNGIWRLEVVDRAGGDVGSLTAWSISYNIAERATTSTASGSYLLPNLPAGAYRIREVMNPGYFRTLPAGGFHPITVGSGTALTGLDFGNQAIPSSNG